MIMTTPFNRPEIIRPPSEWQSYYLPLTSGCSNNSCTFCNYCGSKLQIRDVHDVKREIDALALYVGSGICLPDMSPVVYAIGQRWNGKKVFLQDGDALVYPFPHLRDVLHYLNRQLPHLERIGTYATPQDILRRSVDELKELRALKLAILYMGVESGDNEVLQRVAKGVDTTQVIEAGRKAKEAGITLSVTVILGLGGVQGSARHALETARVLSDIDPEYAGALTLTLTPGTPLYGEWREGKFDLVSPFESLTELMTIVEESSFSDCFFSSMHASNYFAIRGRLPHDKQRMLNELEHIVSERDPSMLRPEFMRGL